MATACIPQVTFQGEGFAKAVVARFDTPHASSDGGAILLKSVDTHLGLTKRLAGCLVDARQPGKIRHQTLELIRQRVFGIACGYADCNDAARLADDAIHKLLVERDPIAGPALASQPTLSRFENAVGPRALVAMGHLLADTVIEQHRRRLKGRAARITIDLDPTDDPTHGQQEFTFFNGHYDTWCYLPIVATVTFDDEPAQYAVTAVLRPGNAPAKRGALGLLRRLFTTLRAAFPTATLRVRLDGGFASNPLFAFLEAAGVEYVVGMPGNVRLDKRIQRLMGKARMRSKTTGGTEQLYGQTRYAAKTWSRKRRVVMKAEVVRHPGRAPKNNPRFVVTNLADEPPGRLRALLPARGHGKPPQGTASRIGDGPDQLLPVSGQPVARAADPGRVHPVPGTAAARAAHGLGGRAGDDAPGAVDQARGVGRTVGTPDRVALPRGVSLVPPVAADRARRGRHVLNRSEPPTPSRIRDMVSLAGRLQTRPLSAPRVMAPDVERMPAPMRCLTPRTTGPRPAAALGVSLVCLHE